MIIIDKGLTDYDVMLALQRNLFTSMVESKKAGETIKEEYLLLTEHKPVITMGKHAKSENLLLPEEILAKQGIPVFHIERGGDLTYHAPGQLVVYPLIDLERHHLGIKDYVNLLEEAVIRTISYFGIRGERINGASGVWIDSGTSCERKICAIGVKCSRYITMHGLALNVNTDLSGFSTINPCGFVDKGVTSIKEETDFEQDMNEIKQILAREFKLLLI